MEKKKVVIDFTKLSDELVTLFEETYPTGVAGKTIRFPNAKGEIVSAVRMENDDTIFLVKIASRPKEVLSDEELDELVKPSGKEKDEELESDEQEIDDDDVAPEDDAGSDDDED